MKNLIIYIILIITFSSCTNNQALRDEISMLQARISVQDGRIAIKDSLNTSLSLNLSAYKDSVSNLKEENGVLQSKIIFCSAQVEELWVQRGEFLRELNETRELLAKCDSSKADGQSGITFLNNELSACEVALSDVFSNYYLAPKQYTDSIYNEYLTLQAQNSNISTIDSLSYEYSEITTTLYLINTLLAINN